MASGNPTYFWPVKVQIPVDGGQYHTETFDAEFKRLPQSKVVKMLDHDDRNDHDFCLEVVAGWKGVTDENGKEIPFSVGALEKLLDFPAVAAAIARTFIESRNGGGDKRKN